MNKPRTFFIFVEAIRIFASLSPVAKNHRYEVTFKIGVDISFSPLLWEVGWKILFGVSAANSCTSKFIELIIKKY